MVSNKINSEILYQRLLRFAQACQKVVIELPKTVYNEVYGKQLIRSSSSPGSNYIEAVEASSRKEFIHKLKTCRKEAKESIHWLVLIESSNIKIEEINKECQELIREGRELIRIFTASVLTAEKNQEIIKIKK